MKQLDDLSMRRIGEAPQLPLSINETTLPEVQEFSQYVRDIAGNHLDAIAMGLLEATANDERGYTYEVLSRNWSSPELVTLLESVLRDYVNSQEGWECKLVLVGDHDTSQDLPYNDLNPSYRDPQQRVVVIAERS